MAFNQNLVDQLKTELINKSIVFTEKKMFGGLALLVNEKMCINVSGNNLMCRFNPDKTIEVEKMLGYLPMKMRNKIYKGYCYVEPIGFKKRDQLLYWLELCLDYNEQAKKSK